MNMGGRGAQAQWVLSSAGGDAADARRTALSLRLPQAWNSPAGNSPLTCAPPLNARGAGRRRLAASPLARLADRGRSTAAIHAWRHVRRDDGKVGVAVG